MSRILTMHYPVIEVKRVVDGDTYDLHLDLGLRQYGHYRIRLAFYDTPEVYGRYASEEGEAATEFVKQWLAEHDNVWVEVVEEGSFSRWIARVYDGDDDLGNALFDAGLAKEYE